MTIFDKYGPPCPIFKAVTVLYVGDLFGFAQLARYVKVVAFQPEEIPTIFKAVEPDAVVITPLAGRNATGQWTSLGAMASLSEFPPYSDLVSAAERHDIPVIGWLHNEPAAFDENSLLAQSSDYIWTSDSRSAERHMALGRVTTVVRNLPSSPLRATQNHETAAPSTAKKLGVALQDFSMKGRKTTPGRNYRDFFASAGFDYVEWSEFTRAKAKMFSEDARWISAGYATPKISSPSHFLAFRANSGIKQTFDFLNFVLEGSFPIGLIDPEGGSLHRNPLSNVFDTEKLHLHSLEEIRHYGISLIDETTYWTYWTDIVRNGLFGHDVVKALQFTQILGGFVPELSRTVQLPCSDVAQATLAELTPLLDQNTGIVFEDGSRAKNFDVVDQKIRVTSSRAGEQAKSPQPSALIRFQEPDPSKRTIETALALSRYSETKMTLKIPKTDPGSNIGWAKIDFRSDRKAES